MNRRKTLMAAMMLAAAAPAAVLAQDVAITNARLVIGDGSAPIDGGTVIVRGGKVVAAGRGAAVPSGMASIDAGGRYVTPGITVGFSRIGLVEVDAVAGSNDRSAARSRFSAGLDIAPALNPAGTGIAYNRAAGITRSLVFPDSGGGLFAGRGAVVDLGSDMDMVTRPRAFQFAVLGEDGARRAGGSRSASFLMLREQLLAARQPVGGNLAAASTDALLQPADVLALARVVDGRDRLFVRVDRASEIINVLGLRRDFPAIRLVLVGAAEGWRVAPQLAAANVPVIVSALTDLPSDFEQLAATQSNAGRLHAAGVAVTIGIFGDDDVHKLGYTLQYAGNIVALTRVPGATGMAWDAAFAAITSAPARAVGMDDVIGSLRPGRVGDVVIWNGDPLELASRPERVWIDGVEQSLATRQDALARRYRDTARTDLPLAYPR